MCIISNVVYYSSATEGVRCISVIPMAVKKLPGCM